MNDQQVGLCFNGENYVKSPLLLQEERKSSSHTFEVSITCLRTAKRGKRMHRYVMHDPGGATCKSFCAE